MSQHEIPRLAESNSGSLPLLLPMAPGRSYVHLLGPKAGIIYILGALPEGSKCPSTRYLLKTTITIPNIEALSWVHTEPLKSTNGF